MKKQPSPAQFGYIRHLERLVGEEPRRPSTMSNAKSRIRRLKEKARAFGVPAYKFEPAPVKIYYDESVKRPASKPPHLNRWL